MKKLIFAWFCGVFAIKAIGAMFSAQWENDFPFDSDDDYTNGLRLEYNWDR